MKDYLMKLNKMNYLSIKTTNTISQVIFLIFLTQKSRLNSKINKQFMILMQQANMVIMFHLKISKGTYFLSYLWINRMLKPKYKAYKNY